MLPTPNPDGTYHDGDGEIDIMEQVGTDPTRTEAHLHHNGTVGKSYDTGIDLSAGFHTYGLDWEADHLTWYFDGTPFYTVTQNVPNVAEYVIFNLAVGDATSWPGAPDANTVLPQSFQIDYVRLYEPAPAQQAPLPGDTNLDGVVNVVDIGTLATNFGMSSGATWAQGDFNGDGNVNVADLGMLATNFGKSSSSSASSTSSATSAATTATASLATALVQTSPTSSNASSQTVASTTGLTTDTLSGSVNTMVKSNFSKVRI
jgi:beta-glucanase (GH16 family)